MSITPSTTTASLRPPVQSTANTSIKNGPTAGNALDGKGSDFLDPNTVLGSSTSFSNSITPVRSNTTQAALFNNNPLGSNPDPLDILNGTNRGLNRALNFDLFFNPFNVNPLGWVNPSPTDIILGSLNGENSILRGSPMFIPISPLPGSGVIGPPSVFGSPATINVPLTGGTGSQIGNGVSQVGGGTTVGNGAGSIIQQPGTISGSPVGFGQLPTGQGGTGSLFPFPVQGSQGVPMQSFGQQVDLMNSLMAMSGQIISSMMAQLFNTSQVGSAYGGTGMPVLQPYQYF